MRLATRKLNSEITRSKVDGAAHVQRHKPGHHQHAEPAAKAPLAKRTASAKPV